MSAGVLEAVRWGAVIPLDHPNSFFTWGWLSISYSNLMVIGLMVATFLGAILIPFPGHKKSGAK